MNWEFEEEELRAYMARCIELAKEQRPGGIRKPYVGALVLSPDRKIIGEGAKNFVEGTSLTRHAERTALEEAGESARGSCLFTTLEPCLKVSEHQLFDSCANLIIKSGIEIVVVGLLDQSRNMKPGQGTDYLTGKGVTIRRYRYLEQSICKELMPVDYIGNRPVLSGFRKVLNYY